MLKSKFLEEIPAYRESLMMDQQQMCSIMLYYEFCFCMSAHQFFTIRELWNYFVPKPLGKWMKIAEHREEDNADNIPEILKEYLIDCYKEGSVSPTEPGQDENEKPINEGQLLALKKQLESSKRMPLKQLTLLPQSENDGELGLDSLSIDNNWFQNCDNLADNIPSNDSQGNFRW